MNLIVKKIIAFLLFFSLTFFAWAQPNQNEQLGIKYFQNGEYEKAKEMFRSIYEKKSDSYIYYYYYRTLLELKDFKELEKLVKNQQKLYPKNQRYIVELGFVYETMGDVQKATKEYDNAIKNVSAQKNSYIELYNAFLSIAKRDYAIETLLKGRKALNEPKAFTKELTNLYTQLNLTDKVIAEALLLVADNDESYLRETEQIIQDLLLDDQDKQKYLTIRTILQRNVQKEPNNFCYLSLLYWVYQLNKDFQEALVLAKTIDKRTKGDGAVLYDLAQTASDNRDYETATEALQYILKMPNSAYFTSAQFELLNVKYEKLISESPVRMIDAINLEKEFKKLIDENGIQPGIFTWIRKYARLLAFYINKPQDAIQLLQQAITSSEKDARAKAQLKVDMADIMLFTGDVWDATLLYSQVDKEFSNDTIGHTAKFKNAKLSFYIGEFAWAKSQLDILRAATSKLIANDAMYLYFVISDNEEDDDEDEEDEIEALFNDRSDNNIALRYFAKADLMLFQNNDQGVLNYLDSVNIYAPFSKLNDDVLYLRAQILTKRKEYFAAENLYKKILETYPDDLLADDALFKLAELYDYYIKDIPKAMECYQRLLKDYPDSLFVVDARKRFRELRGDF